MYSKHAFPLSLLVVAILSGCSSVPPNANLMAAHSRYDGAAFNPDVVNQAPLELQEANTTLAAADSSFTKGQDEADVNHLAYMASQQVAIAEETAKRKVSELVVANAKANSDKIRLTSRTEEADSAAQKLVIAGANAERDQALIAQLKSLNAKQTERGMMITLGDVLFNTDRSELKPGGIRNMEKLAQFMTQYPAYKVSVEGHTDSRASNGYNQKLSQRRADAVQTVLLDSAITNDRIATQGYGERYPVANNRTPAGRQLNRRVEVILSDSNGNVTQR